MSNWELSLRQGEWFEDNIAKPWLLDNMQGWWITDSRNHIRTGGSTGGPKLSQKNAVITLPDFRLDDPATGTSSWMDAKYKNKGFPLPGFDYFDKFVSLDTKAYREYTKVVAAFPNMPFEIMFGVRRTKTLYLLNFKTAIPVWHEFDNGYNRNGDKLTPCYALDEMTNLGAWNPTGLPLR